MPTHETSSAVGWRERSELQSTEPKANCNCVCHQLMRGRGHSQWVARVDRSLDQRLRYWVLCVYCRRRKYSTPKVKQHGPSGAYPIVSLAALVKLADWYQAHQRPPQGVQPCANPSHGLIPPRAGNAPATDNAAPALGHAARRAPAAGPSGAQSGRHAAASAARRQGGEA